MNTVEWPEQVLARSRGTVIDSKAEGKRLRELERRYKVLKEEHGLLKKAIRFAADRKRKSSSS